MYKITVSLLLPASLSLHVPLNAFGGSSLLHPALHGEQVSDCVLQDPSQRPAPQTPPANNDKLALSDGTPVRLKFARAVVSSRIIAGEKVPLEVIEPVLVSNLIVIPQNSPAEAIVTMAQAGRSMARGGNLQLKIENIRLADGELVPVRAVKDVQGQGRKALRIATLPFWSFDIKGKNATIPAGAEITAYIVGDFPLDASKFQTAGASPHQKEVPK